VYILNERLEPQPVGVPGELFIGGDGVARGYLNRAELTKELFIGNPFTGSGRIYRTGDQARWRNDGTVEHLGRLDQQIKVRGYRIEPGEIETYLSENPAVTNCAVALYENRPGDQRLIAYYVPDALVSTTVTALRSHLKSYLPSYMIPQHFIEIDSLPLTPNGKIDRNALPNPDGSIDSGQQYAAPSTDAEKQLADLWIEMLGIDRVGTRDNFFDIGGHSLLAIRARAAMEERFSAKVTLQSLTSDTLAQIAVAHQEQLGIKSDGSAVSKRINQGSSTLAGIAAFLGKMWRR
jgi:hypothetical protein